MKTKSTDESQDTPLPTKMERTDFLEIKCAQQEEELRRRDFQAAMERRAALGRAMTEKYQLVPADVIQEDGTISRAPRG